jgi:hypothetical protein
LAFDEPHEAEVLHDDRIDTRGRHGFDELRDRFEFVGKDECVERDETPHVASVEEPHHVW